jgi:hypothetical protein
MLPRCASDAPTQNVHNESRLVRTLTFKGNNGASAPRERFDANRERPGYSALISEVMSLTDAFASPNSIAVFAS